MGTTRSKFVKNQFRKFYNKSLSERHEILAEINLLDDVNELTLSSETANNMVENYIANYEIPLGLAFNFIVDEEELVIPMAIEEPSVIAAASNGGKTLGNIKTVLDVKNSIGQIVLTDLTDIDTAAKAIQDNTTTLISQANEVSASMVKRGGGLKKIWTEQFNEFLTIYFSIDTVDAMGANTVNTILEHLSPYIQDLTGAEAILNIISNYATDAIVRAYAEVPISKLHWHKDQGIEIAKKIEQATNYANLDPYRATTHNKGIMNGIGAVTIATGNDWRAVEAGAHAYAARDGQYKSLTSWIYNSETEKLEGSIELPMPVGTVGGTISVHPFSKWSLETLNNPTAKRLASIIAAVGLAQNFSALKALVTEGIQAGHMNLQARSVALQAGAKEEEISALVAELNKAKNYGVAFAKEALGKIRGK